MAIKKKFTFTILIILSLFLIPVMASAGTDIAWTKTIGSVTAADISEYGDFIYSGTDNGTFTCYDASGSLLWQKSLTGGQITKIRTSGNYVVAITGIYGYLYNSDGDLQYSETFSSTLTDVDLSVSGFCIYISATQFWNYNVAGEISGTYTGTFNQGIIDQESGYNLISETTGTSLYQYILNSSVGWTNYNNTQFYDSFQPWGNRVKFTPINAGNFSLNVTNVAIDNVTDLLIPDSVSSPFESDKINNEVRVVDGNQNGLDFIFQTYKGLEWAQATPAANWTARKYHTSVVFDDKIWVMGGEAGGYKNDVWYSEDGVNWIEATPAANWTARYSHTSVVFDDKIWVMGGEAGGYKNDVWYSEDGVNWIEATPAANWTARYYHTSVVYDDKIWVMGGEAGGYKNDVWYSEDGVNWIEATPAANWTARNLHTSVVFDDKIWVMGGYSPYHNDVWYSEDGVNWIEATPAANWTARYYHTSVVFDDKIWVIGGYNGGCKNDVWYSEDGVNWIEATPAANWTARYSHTSVVFDDKIWVIGGYTSSYKNDVWYYNIPNYVLLDIQKPTTSDFYVYYNNPAAEMPAHVIIPDTTHFNGTKESAETIQEETITTYQDTEVYADEILAIDVPESGSWVGVSTAGYIYHTPVTVAGFGASYSEATSGTAYDIATADSASMSIEGRGIIADIYQIDAVKVGTYTTGGTVSKVAIADKNALWAASGGTDGKVYVFSKDESSAWYLDYASDSYEPITTLAMSWRGEYIVAGRGDGLTLYQTGEETSSDTTMWFTLYVFKDQERYTYAPVNVSVYQDEVWTSLTEGLTDSDGKYVIQLIAGTKYKFNINEEKIIILDASPTLTSKTINILTSPVSTAIDYSASYNSTSNEIEMSYEDITDTTDSVTFTVYRTDTWERVYTNSIADSGDVEDSFHVVDDTVDYKVELTADRPTGAITNHFFVSTGDFSIPLPLDNNLKNAILSCFLIFISGLFGYVSSARGAIVVSFVAGAFVYFGWLTIPVYWVVIAIVISLLAGFSQRRI